MIVQESVMRLSRDKLDQRGRIKVNASGVQFRSKGELDHLSTSSHGELGHWRPASHSKRYFLSMKKAGVC